MAGTIKEAYVFIEGKLYPDIGYCMWTSGDFCTMAHHTPCTASVANVMDMNGWEIYVQPYKTFVMDFDKDRESYIVTYRKTNRE